MSSDCDQGLFYYLYYVKHSIGAFGRALGGGEPHGGGEAHARGRGVGSRLVSPLSRHWWASFKPWRHHPLGGRLRVARPSP